MSPYERLEHLKDKLDESSIREYEVLGWCGSDGEYVVQVQTKDSGNKFGMQFNIYDVDKTEINQRVEEFEAAVSGVSGCLGGSLYE